MSVAMIWVKYLGKRVGRSACSITWTLPSAPAVACTTLGLAQVYRSFA